MSYEGPHPIPVPSGGTGDASFTAYSVLAGGTTSTGALQNVSGVGTSGQVLTSNGAAALPTWQPTGSGSGFTSISMQTFTSSGTYTPTSGMLYCIVEAVGGGGGGGGTTSSSTGGGGAGGGGAGGYSRGVYSAATIGASQTVTIGGGGGGATGTGSSGTATSLGALMTCNGGSGGAGMLSSTASITGGSGGSASGGSVNITGGSGQDGGANTTGGNYQFLNSGAGASTVFGSGGAAFGSGIANAGGRSAVGFGAGGGGAAEQPTTSNQTGGNGAAGFMLITEFV